MTLRAVVIEAKDVEESMERLSWFLNHTQHQQDISGVQSEPGCLQGTALPPILNTLES